LFHQQGFWGRRWDRIIPFSFLIELSVHLSDLKLTFLFDNVPCDPQLECLWGFACLVELPGQRLLFDTGSNGRVLLKNIQALDMDSGGLDSLFISHAHWDHMGGLDSILELNPDLHLIVPSGLSPRMIPDLRKLCGQLTIIGDRATPIFPNLASTGSLSGDPVEQALVMSTEEGAVVITGCAHPGIAKIAQVAMDQTGLPLALLAGGFHLFDTSNEDVASVAQELAALGIRHILPTHCTGEAATEKLREVFGAGFIPGGSGQIIGFDADGQPEVLLSGQEVG
jgi:7,8-dihydropterin-6-yl-methyl-4-(beta-D-ribofuranosyl)aminobenzene 5'-phosphate synthase